MLVVVNDQYPTIAHIRRRQGHALVRTGQLKSRGKPKGAALSLDCIDPHLAAHQFGQAFGDHQPKAGAAVLTGRRSIGLLERLEELVLLLCRHANAGILHLKTHHDTAAGLLYLADLNDDFARFGELDGVVGIVDQHLSYPQRIAAQMAGQFRVDIENQLKIFVGDLVTDKTGDIVEHVVDPKIDRFDIELAGVDLRKIEYVVDNPEQMLARVVDLADIVALFGVEIRSQRQMRHADNRVHWRADLMRHIGEEVGFGLRGGLGRVARAMRFFLTLFDRARHLTESPGDHKGQHQTDNQRDTRDDRDQPYIAIVRSDQLRAELVLHSLDIEFDVFDMLGDRRSNAIERARDQLIASKYDDDKFLEGLLVVGKIGLDIGEHFAAMRILQFGVERCEPIAHIGEFYVHAIDRTLVVVDEEFRDIEPGQ